MSKKYIKQKVAESTQLSEVIENEPIEDEEKLTECVKFISVVDKSSEKCNSEDVTENDYLSIQKKSEELQYTAVKIRPKECTEGISTLKKKGIKNMLSIFKKRDIQTEDMNTQLVKRYQRAVAELNRLYTVIDLTTNEAELTYLYAAEKAQKAKIAMLFASAKENKISASTSIFFNSVRKY